MPEYRHLTAQEVSQKYIGFRPSIQEKPHDRSQPIESLLGVSDVRLDPDGKRVAFNLGVIANTFVTILDLDRKLKTQVTPERVFGGYGIWSPDGSRVVFAKGKDNALAATELYERPSNLTAPDSWSAWKTIRSCTRGTGRGMARS